MTDVVGRAYESDGRSDAPATPDTRGAGAARGRTRLCEMVERLIRLSVLLMSALGLSGCAATPKAAVPAGVPGLTEYYEKATAPHRRAVRKPVHDEQVHALRMLREHARALLAETESWDTDARLVSLAESERPAAREAVAEFRCALAELETAAANSDLHAVRHAYERAMVSYRHLHETLGLID